MTIQRITLTNFQCFGPEPESIDLTEMTVFIGPNGAGKTAILEALNRVFGATAHQRSLTRKDFHVPHGKTLDELGSVQMRIDVVIIPQLGDDSLSLREMAGTFGQMVVEEEGGQPFVRAVLEATWNPGPTIEGVIETQIYWATTSESPVPEQKRIRMSAVDRTQILVHYVPASRDPEQQLHNVSGTLLHRVFRAIEWGDTVGTDVADAVAAVAKILEVEKGVELFDGKVKDSWAQLHPTKPFGTPSISFLGQDLDDTLRQATMVFSTGPDGAPSRLERLSDGQRSLFYLSLIGAVFDLETDVINSDPQDGTEPAPGSPASLISPQRLSVPLLSLFAIEEPENHLSPHYLGRIVTMLASIAKSPSAQVALTTHSPSIMGRVPPESVTHVRQTNAGVSKASRLPLPVDDADAAKFVREAVLSNPELYFADLVVLGEGDSEAIVLPQLLRVAGTDPDPMRVSVVPLGGRFVHHFWRLLKGLGIPTVTLLDFDRGRFGGGWGRIKHACEQLVANGVDWAELCKGLPSESGSIASDHTLANLHARKDAYYKDWRARLETYQVFYSYPLDLDYSMLRAYGEQYLETSDADVALPGNEPDRSDEITRVIRSVLGKKGDPASYKVGFEPWFAWYEELFLKNSKPVTHMQAIAKLEDRELVDDMPPVLKRLCDAVFKETNA